jgi:hypothetical protein
MVEDFDHLDTPEGDYFSEGFSVIPLNPLTAEYAAATLDLVGRKIYIDSVERVLNHQNTERFLACLGDSPSSVLWHGTGPKNLSSILSEGLDNHYSLRGHFGRGIYFSDHPAKAHSYTRKGERILLLCKVALGRIKKYERGANNPSLIEPPEGFDSACGNISGHDEYAVYDKTRVDIEYVVRYTVIPPPPPPDEIEAIVNELRGLERN